MCNAWKISSGIRVLKAICSRKKLFTDFETCLFQEIVHMLKRKWVIDADLKSEALNMLYVLGLEFLRS